MPEKIEIRSDEVREIMERVPGWVIRWGTSFVFGFILIVLAGSYFFNYPTIIYSDIIVTTENPPASLIARSSGRIDEIFAEDAQYVFKGQTIAIIENPAEYQDVLSLKDKLTFVNDFFYYYDPELVSVFTGNLELGELQSEYTTFIKKLNDYRNFIELDYHAKKIRSLSKKLKYYNDYYKRLLKQSELLKDKLELIKKQFERDSTLFQRKVISNAAYEKSKSELIKEQYELEQVELNLSSTEIDIAELRKEMLELELKQSEESKQLKLQLQEAYENLLAEVSAWELRYVITAPVDGQLSFTKIWSKNQIVRQGEVVFTIIPQKPGQIIGKINLPAKGSGKVKKGQQVNIKFDNYPFMEYGIVKGKVKAISLVPEDNIYFLEVSLPNGLSTTYDKELSFNQEMPGIAEIITEERSLLRRIVDPLKYIFERNFKK